MLLLWFQTPPPPPLLGSLFGEKSGGLMGVCFITLSYYFLVGAVYAKRGELSRSAQPSVHDEEGGLRSWSAFNRASVISGAIEKTRFSMLVIVKVTAEAFAQHGSTDRRCFAKFK